MCPSQSFEGHENPQRKQGQRFVSWIAVNPTAGDIIPNADGVRKVRWSTKGTGKRGGVRVIYFNVDQDILLLIDIYKKNKKADISIKEIKKAQ